MTIKNYLHHGILSIHTETVGKKWSFYQSPCSRHSLTQPDMCSMTSTSVYTMSMWTKAWGKLSFQVYSVDAPVLSGTTMMARRFKHALVGMEPILWKDTPDEYGPPTYWEKNKACIWPFNRPLCRPRGIWKHYTGSTTKASVRIHSLGNSR